MSKPITPGGSLPHCTRKATAWKRGVETYLRRVTPRRKISRSAGPRETTSRGCSTFVNMIGAELAHRGARHRDETGRNPCAVEDANIESAAIHLSNNHLQALAVSVERAMSNARALGRA